ncbi:MAG: hypothetical protein EP298_00210 [Gammaproteobacteria bacterium]|nr:MAG: hypothetical protein EP298_00210 [Gammaproteobacteria bacterium]UTW41509.1 hypothetical protein KFE69_08290 [bacterium SCSIO 12844]
MNYFKSRVAAYSYLIKLLLEYRTKPICNLNQSAINHFVNNLFIALENHEQNINKHLKPLKFVINKTLSTDPESAKSLSEIINAIDIINNSKFDQTPQEMWENEIGRQFESLIAIELLLDPTSKMMERVSEVSSAIVKNLNNDNNKHSDRINLFLISLEENFSPIALGAFKEIPTLDKVLEILNNNDSDQLSEIIHIHFKFAQVLYRRLSIYNLNNELVEHPSYLPDDIIYPSSLFKQSPNRGRFGRLDTNKKTDQLGIMLECQTKGTIPKRIDNKWTPDCIAQQPQLDNKHNDYWIVRDMIENDTPYVAGYSGMTSLLIPQMMALCAIDDQSKIRDYLNAVIGYICGGGFHSIHEILGPCAKFLSLIPGYQVADPGVTKSLPPNYNHYFTLIQRYDQDPELKERFAQVKIKFIEYLISVDWSKHLTSNNNQNSLLFYDQDDVKKDQKTINLKAS